MTTTPSIPSTLCFRPAMKKDIPACEAVLRSLPKWFGIEESIVDYVGALPGLSVYLVESDKQVEGFISLEKLNYSTHEIHVLAVREHLHNKGIGRKFFEWASNVAKREGAEFLSVKTLSDKADSKEYAQTRAFYSAVGFKPIMEFKDYWSKKNPCLIMVKTL